MADGDFWGFPGGWWGAGSAGLGAGADLYAFFQQLQQRDQQQRLYDIQANPKKLAAYAGQLMPTYSPEATAVFNRGVNADWASVTGGAPGGAAAQFSADAWAKLISSNWATALREAIGALSGARGNIPQAGQMGNFGNIMQKLLALKGIQQRPQETNLAPNFVGSGSGGDYAGSSDYLRSGDTSYGLGPVE